MNVIVKSKNKKKTNNRMLDWKIKKNLKIISFLDKKKKTSLIINLKKKIYKYTKTVRLCITLLYNFLWTKMNTKTNCKFPHQLILP